MMRDFNLFLYFTYTPPRSCRIHQFFVKIGDSFVEVFDLGLCSLFFGFDVAALCAGLDVFNGFHDVESVFACLFC